VHDERVTTPQSAGPASPTLPRWRARDTLRNMLFERRLVGATLLALVCACSSPSSISGSQGQSAASSATVVEDTPDNLPEVAADPRERLLAELSTVLLTQRHLLRRPLDDALSKEAFPKYIEELDGAKLLLLEEHVQALSRYADRMDDELRDRDLVLARKGAALVATRRKLTAKMVAEILAKPFDYTVAEEIETDPEKLAFSKSDAELRQRWHGVLKLQALERIQQMEEIVAAKDKGAKKDADAVDKTLESIPETPEAREEKARKDLATRYETRFTRLETMDPLEPAERFLNAVSAAYDPHTQYLAPAEKANFDIAISGTLEGIGAVLGEQDHYVVVQELVPGGASWQEGSLEAGDLIIAVAQKGKAPVDVTDMPIDKVVKMIRGPKGTVVILTVKKADGSVQNISITRDVVHVEATYARGAVLDLGPDDEAMGYVYLPGFYGGVDERPGERNATDDVQKLLGEFQSRKLGGVVIDLRGNGGGLLSHARDISGLFLPRGPVVQTRDSTGKVNVLSDTDPAVAFAGEVVVLVDRFSASAAEILAAALQDHERAVVVGTGATHGKGTVQAVVELDRLLETPLPPKDPLGVFKLTVEQYFRVSGGSVQWKGVMPDVVLPDPAAFIKSGERTLYHSIPWTSVKALPYRPYPHGWKAPELAAASSKRVKSHALFNKIAEFSKLMKARRDETRLSLEKSTWLAKKKRDKEALEAADPKLKDQKPLFELQAVFESAVPTRPSDKKVRQKLDSWKDELARDPWVAESLHVLTDMTKK
jgi:carboxyl-terminal processing protease